MTTANQQQKAEPKYPWFKLVENNQNITQGDLLEKVPVVVMVPDESHPFFAVKPKNISQGIVITQSCDFQKAKVRDITICPVSSFRELINNIMRSKYGTADGLNDEQLADKNYIMEEFRKGHYLDYYLLNKHSFPDNSKFDLDYQVVHLRQSYTIPKDVLYKVFSNRNGQRVQLLLPYREHLAQAYGRNFYRIGLPIDIEFSEGEI